MAAAGLLAREIDRAAQGEPAVGHDVHEACANCGAVRQGPYCHECGQAGHVHRTLGALVHDIAHGVFHFEGKLAATLPLLVWKPGELTRRYVAGERAKFVSPVALFLFSVFLMFTIVSSLAGHGETHPADARTRATVAAERGKAEAKVRALEARLPGTRGAERTRVEAALAENKRAALALRSIANFQGMDSAATEPDIDLGWPWASALVNHAARNPDLLLYKMKSYAYKYSWALIPLSLPFLWLLFAFRRDVGLYDHAIFATYSLSFMSLGVVALVLASAIGAPGDLVTLAATIVPPVHMYRQLKGAYRLRWPGALWRTAALLLITLITSALFATFVFYLGAD